MRARARRRRRSALAAAGASNAAARPAGRRRRRHASSWATRIDPDERARARARPRARRARRSPGRSRRCRPTARCSSSTTRARGPGRARRRAARERAALAGAERARSGPLRTIPDALRRRGRSRPRGRRRRAWASIRTSIVRLHAAREYTALMLGFMPGFAYLGIAAAEARTPRRATPRVRVPAGSVAIAGRQTARLPRRRRPAAGTCSAARRCVSSIRWRDPPALIQPGDRVRFVPVGELPAPAVRVPVAAADGRPALEVLEPGLLTTVQDVGRRGLPAAGRVAGPGALDAAARRAPRTRCSATPGRRGAGVHGRGPHAALPLATRFAVTGADLGAVLQREDLGAWPVPLGVRVLARAGNVLASRARRWGCRAYVAFAGGLAVPLVLGLARHGPGRGFGGFGGRALRAGDRLGRRRGARASPALEQAGGPADAGTRHAARRARAAGRRLRARLAGALPLGAVRGGRRLQPRRLPARGPRLVHRGAPEILSDGWCRARSRSRPTASPS